MATHAPWPILALVGLAAPACFTDTMNTSAGPDDASSSTAASPAATDTQPASDASTSTTTPVDPTTSPTATASTADETTTPDATTTSVGTTSTSTTTTDDTTTTETPGCDVELIEKAEKALLTPPMQKVQNQAEGTIAFSLVAGEGTAEFTFDINCAGTYHLWARVLDLSPGVGNGQDPDSFAVSFDGEPKIEWLYGCKTATAWSWQLVQEQDSIACLGADAYTLDLGSGQHTITLGNLEEGVLDKYAAVARVLVTSDPNFVPTSE
jgi:hypothetical protein